MNPNEANALDGSAHDLALMRPIAPRLASIDAYRGFVMFLMIGEVLAFSQLADSFPESEFWRVLAFHQSHVAWRGCSLHDLIQPSFSFLVGVALPFSLAIRRRRGEPVAWSLLHAAWRSFVLIALGIFLRSMGQEGEARTNFTFEDTLTQIGLGYFPLFVAGLAPPKIRWGALIVILLGYWAAFALYPLPGPDFDYAGVNVAPDWVHNASGFAAHWNKNSNLAWSFDRWLLNLFPRPQPFTHNDGGYATLSFIPTLGTMLLGLLAGDWLRGDASSARKVGWITLAGVVSLGLGYGADRLGICPTVKRIWTPSWTLFSGGWCFLMMAGFFVLNDVAGTTGWSMPLRVVGANSIAAYVLAHTIHGFVLESFRIHLGRKIFSVFGSNYEPLIAGATVLLVYWLILFWMYRRRIFLRI